MIADMPIEQIVLRIEEMCSSCLIDETVPRENVRGFVNYRIEHLAHQLSAMLKYPALVLQENKLLADYPDGLWQYVRRALGLGCRRIEVRLTEHLAYPTIALPPLKETGRLVAYTSAWPVKFPYQEE